METSDPEGGGTALGMHAQAKETEDVEEKATRNETMERGLVVMQLPSTWPDEPSAARVERAVAEAFHHQKGFRNAWLVWPGVGRTNDVMVEDEEGKSPNNNDCTTCVLHFDSERNASRTVRTLLQFAAKVFHTETEKAGEKQLLPPSLAFSSAVLRMALAHHEEVTRHQEHG